MEGEEDGVPFGLVAEVVKDHGGEDEVEAIRSEVCGADIGLDRDENGVFDSGDAFNGTVKHGPAEVEERGFADCGE